MEAVFLKVLELSCYGSLLILAILPVRLLLQKAPRWSICLLWALAAIALVCPLRLESAVSVMPSDISIANPVIAPSSPVVQTEPILTPTLPVENGAHTITPTEPDYAVIASIFWLIGMAVMLTVAAVSYLRLKRQVSVSLLVKNNVYLCDSIDSPFILGFLRPRIYLPSSLDKTLYSAVLRHEYAHLMRRDHWWKPLGYLLLTVHWFNPLVWLGYTLLCRDIELACDEKVIRDMDSRHKKDYSEALLQCSMPRRLITACPLAFGEVGAKQRIKAVLNYKKPAFWVIVIALIVCAALAVSFLTKPKVTRLGEMSDLTAEDITLISFTNGTYIGEESIRSTKEPSALCEALSKVELRKRVAPLFEYYDPWHLVYLQTGEDDGVYYHIIVAPDYTALKITNVDNDRRNSHKDRGYYEVLNPTHLEQIFSSAEFFEIEETSDTITTTVITDTSLTYTEMQTLIEEHLRENNRHFANLQMQHYTYVTPQNGMTYTIFSMDHLSHDGSVTAENCLYLAAFVNGRLDGIASGEWAMSAGYYPNLAEFNGNTILWITRGATRLEVNDDGTPNPDKLVPNDYDSYRIDFDDGTICWYNDNDNDIDFPLFYPLEKGLRITRIAPLDHRGNPVEAFTFTAEHLTVANVNTISEKSGWDVFLEMNEDTGEIDVLCGYPTYEDMQLYLDMDESFTDYKALYKALSHAEQNFPNLKLLGQQSYGDYEYAVIQYDSDKEPITALVEYTIEGSAVTLLTYAEGYLPDTQGFLTGYCMNCASMEGGLMYWSLYATRYGVSPNGKEVDSTKTVTPSFSGFRFTMRDLETNTFPAEGNFFLCEFSTVIPPAIVTPMENGKLLAALGSEAPSFTANSYSFVKD